jgi:hypothetical protein
MVEAAMWAGVEKERGVRFLFVSASTIFTRRCGILQDAGYFF